jgi:hypothetical protein
MLKHTGQNIGLKFYLLILGAEKLASMLNIALISCITRQEQSKDIKRMIRSCAPNHRLNNDQQTKCKEDKQEITKYFTEN